MTGADLLAEFVAAQKAMTADDRRALMAAGIGAMDVLLLVGRVPHASRRGDLWEPADSGPAIYITSAFVHYPDTPETTCPTQAVRFGDIVDLIAWDIGHPNSWALRTGAAEWLGACGPQYCDPDPVRIYRGVLGWLQNRCDGIVLLSRDPTDKYRVLARLQHP
jgi:hypothetical protein